MHMAAVSPESAKDPIRSFGTFTSDLHALAEWFKACKVTSVRHGIYKRLLDSGLRNS